MNNEYYDMEDDDLYMSDDKKEKTVSDESSRKSTAKKLGISAVSALLFGVIAAAVFLGVTNFGMSRYGKEQEAEETSAEAEDTSNLPTLIPSMTAEESEAAKAEDPAFQNAIATESGSGYLTSTEVVDECMPAMVSITGMSVQEIRSFFGTQQYEAGIAGSGIIVGKTDEELLIATNSHVIDDTNSLSVTFIDENSVEANIKGVDEKNDLAIVSVPLSSISTETLDAISVIKMGDSTELKAGEQVIAIGNALGYGQSVSSGVISAANRTTNQNGVSKNLIQTDAAINPGNSGGALVNMKGELIGINEAKDVGTEIEGVGYAIPISIASPILDDLMNGESRVKLSEEEAGYIGIASSFSIDAERATANNAPEGVYVQYLIDGGAAAEAGIKPGDIITKLNNEELATMEELKEELSYYRAGETVTVVLYRYGDNGYEEMSFDVTLKGVESLNNTVDNGNVTPSPEEAPESGEENYNNGNSDNSGNNGNNGGSSGDSAEDFFGEFGRIFDFGW